MDLRRKTKLNTSAELGTPITSSSPVLTRSRNAKLSPQKSPISIDQSWNSSRHKESFSEDENPNLSDDSSSCNSECEENLTTNSLRNRSSAVVTSSPGKKNRTLSPSRAQNVTLKQDPSPASTSLLKAALPILLILTLAVSLMLTMFPFGPVMQESPRHILANKRETFEANLLKEVKALQSSYPAQPMKTWIEYMAAVTSISDNPSQPAVLLLTTPNSSTAIETTKCIAKQLAGITNRLFNASSKLSYEIHNRKASSGLEDRVKEELDGKIRAILSQSYAIILDDINSIPPKAAMVLHGYCDNFMAPFKQRVIILTAIVNGDQTSNNVDSFLRKLWDPELGEDKAASLVSRVANMPVFINPEERLRTCVD